MHLSIFAEKLPVNQASVEEIDLEALMDMDEVDDEVGGVDAGEYTDMDDDGNDKDDDYIVEDEMDGAQGLDDTITSKYVVAYVATIYPSFYIWKMYFTCTFVYQKSFAGNHPDKVIEKLLLPLIENECQIALSVFRKLFLLSAQETMDQAMCKQSQSSSFFLHSFFCCFVYVVLVKLMVS